MAGTTVAQALERERQRLVLAELFAYMERYGIRRVWLADQLGISRQRIWFYEHAETLPPEWFIPKACKALNVKPESFGYVRPKATQRRAS